MNKDLQATRSPVVFLHGFPDSPKMYETYVTKEERTQDWLIGRSIYMYSFPNRHENPHFPSMLKLMWGIMNYEFDMIMDDLVQTSPTGKLVIVAHDWGGTHAWRWARKKKSPPIESFVALSVGSSFRYDICEHGFNSFAWLSGLWFSLGWYVPCLRFLLSKTLVKYGGYRSETASELWKDAYHYWDRPILLLVFFPRMFCFLGCGCEYLDFDFPVLYIRCRQDRIASTSAFEKLLLGRADCRMLVLDDACHWFPEQRSDLVLPHLRAFLTDPPPQERATALGTPSNFAGD